MSEDFGNDVHPAALQALQEHSAQLASQGSAPRAAQPPMSIEQRLSMQIHAQATGMSSQRSIRDGSIIRLGSSSQRDLSC